MATLKQIRARIKTAKNIQQITRALKLVAAARLKKSTDRVMEARPYSEKLKGLMASLASAGELPQHPLLERREVKKVGIILITAERGLAGSYNTALIRKTSDFIAGLSTPAALITVGKKGTQFFGKRGYEIIESFTLPASGARLEDAIAVTKLARDQFESGAVDAIYVCYSKFYSAIRQTPQMVQLLPIVADQGEAAVSTDFDFEPSPEAIVNTLLPRYFQTLVWQALIEATASFFGAQMTAMTSATDNAGKMIYNLTLIANRERQAGITKEILEVVGGAEALKN